MFLPIIVSFDHFNKNVKGVKIFKPATQKIKKYIVFIFARETIKLLYKSRTCSLQPFDHEPDSLQKHIYGRKLHKSNSVTAVIRP